MLLPPWRCPKPKHELHLKLILRFSNWNTVVKIVTVFTTTVSCGDGKCHWIPPCTGSWRLVIRWKELSRWYMGVVIPTVRALMFTQPHISSSSKSPDWEFKTWEEISKPQRKDRHRKRRVREGGKKRRGLYRSIFLSLFQVWKADRWNFTRPREVLAVTPVELQTSAVCGLNKLLTFQPKSNSCSLLNHGMLGIVWKEVGNVVQ